MTTPTCPNCGAKFMHDEAALICRSCGIPDEILHLGKKAIRDWKIHTLRQMGFSRRHAKDTITQVGGNKSKRRAKHGRKGVKR